MGSDHANAVVGSVRHKDIAICTYGKVAWGFKCSSGTCAIRPCAASTARKGRHCAIGVDEPDAVVGSVSDIHIPTAIHGHTRRLKKGRSASTHAIRKGW